MLGVAIATASECDYFDASAVFFTKQDSPFLLDRFYHVESIPLLGLPLTHFLTCLFLPPASSNHVLSLQRFNPKFASAEMRSKLSDGNPNDPLMIYVGRLGAEKRLRDLKGVLERWARLTAASYVCMFKCPSTINFAESSCLQETAT